MLCRPRLLVGLVICAGIIGLAFAANAADPPAMPKMPDTTPPGKPHFDSTGVQVGEQLPDLPIYLLDGQKRGGWLGGPMLILTSSYTCPKSRSTYPAAAALAAKLGHDIPTVFIYVIEAHPKGDPSPYSGIEDVTVENERDHIFCAQPTSFEERLTLAKRFQKRLEVSDPIYVDGMDNAVWKSLGGGPNMGILIDENRIVLARQGWFDAKSMEAAGEAFRAAMPKGEQGKGLPRIEKSDWEAASAARQGDLNKVKSLIAASPTLTSKVIAYLGRGDVGDRALLQYAVEGKQLPIVALLLSKGADVNIQTIHAPAALHLAARNGDLAIATFLIAHGGKVNLQAQDHGPTPLQEALIHGNVAVAELLIKSGATSNFFTDVATGNLEGVNRRLADDPTVAVRPDGWDRPPLAYAAAADQEKVIAALLAAGAHDLPPSRYKYEGSAIWWAVERKNVPMIRLLCRYGSDPNLLDRAIYGGSLAVVRELLAAKADPNRADISGYRPLHEAVLRDQADVVQLLVDAGADMNAAAGPNRAGCGPPDPEPLFAPLHFAAQQGSTKAIAELLKLGAKVDVLDHSAKTPLHYAANSYVPPANLVAGVKALLEGGASVNAKDAVGSTPLDLALKTARTADKPDSSVVDLLRANGAKPGSEIAGPPGVPPKPPKENGPVDRGLR